MIDLYMILPSEYVYCPGEIDIPICLEHEAVLWLGWKHGDVTAVPIGSINDKTTLHLHCKATYLEPLIAKLDVLFGKIDHMSDENIAQTEQAICFASDIMLCRDLDHIKQRDPDFAITTEIENEDGSILIRETLNDVVIL